MCQWSHQTGSTGLHLIMKVQLHLSRLGLGWVTAYNRKIVDSVINK